MNLIKSLINHELISGSSYIFIGSMVANVLAFLLNLFLARNLSYADYSIFASLLSVITLASIPAGSISTIIVKFATHYFVKEENEKLKQLYLTFFKMILGISILIIVLFLALSVPILNYLNLDNVWYVIITGFAISSFYLNALNTAFLQSLLKFGFISFLNAFGGVVKLAFGILLAILGYRAFSGLWSVFFMTLGMFFLAFIPLSKILSAKSTVKKVSLNTREIFLYAVPTFTTVLFLTSFTSTDVILVKHFFEPRLAGFYAGLSLIGKVIFYFTFPIPVVMFPLLVKRHSTGREFVNLFYLALFLVMFPSIAITAFYFIRPEFVINFFLGGREYLYVAKYLGVFGLYLTVFSMVNVCVNFFLSLNKTKIAFFVIPAAILQIILIYFYHSNFYQVIGVSLFVSSVLLVLLLIAFFRNYWSFGEIKERIAFLTNPSV